MKKRYTTNLIQGSLFAALTFGALVFTSNEALAQPANDNCLNAMMIPFDADSTMCSNTAGTTVGATQSADPTDVCSASWFDDDVWFSFTTPGTIPAGAVTIRTQFDQVANPNDIGNIGMALYAGCGAGELAIACFSGGNDRLSLASTSFSPSTTYYVRVWSSNTTNPNGGTFTICAYSDANFSTACVAGSIATTGPLNVCPSDTGQIVITGAQIPTGGGFGYSFTPGANAGGGIAGGFTLTAAPMTYTFDNDLNGVMSANQLGLLTGTWFLSPVVYTDPGNATATICDTLPTSLQVNFLDASDPSCGGIGIEEISLLDGVVIAPNPTSGIISLSSDKLSSLDGVSVYDLTGRNLQQFGKASFTGNRMDLDLSDQPNGVYLISLEIGADVVMKRVVVQH